VHLFHKRKGEWEDIFSTTHRYGRLSKGARKMRGQVKGKQEKKLLIVRKGGDKPDLSGRKNNSGSYQSDGERQK